MDHFQRGRNDKEDDKKKKEDNHKWKCHVNIPTSSRSMRGHEKQLRDTKRGGEGDKQSLKKLKEDSRNTIIKRTIDTA